jgi:hypothetical protein
VFSLWIIENSIARVREAEEFFLIEVPDNVRKIVIVKAQVHGVMIYITLLSSKRLGCDVWNVWNIEPMKK